MLTVSGVEGGGRGGSQYGLVFQKWGGTKNRVHIKYVETGKQMSDNSELNTHRGELFERKD